MSVGNQTTRRQESRSLWLIVVNDSLEETVATDAVGRQEYDLDYSLDPRDA